MNGHINLYDENKEEFIEAVEAFPLRSVWLIKGSYGDDDSFCEWVVCACVEEIGAKELVKQLQDSEFAKEFDPSFLSGAYGNSSYDYEECEIK
jgi:hypothetical protein